MIKNRRLIGKKEKEPRYPSYATWYKYYQSLDARSLDFDLIFNKGDFFKSDKTNACFAQLFKTLRTAKKGDRFSNNLIDIPEFNNDNSGTLVIGLRLGDFKSGENNYCLLSPSAINEWANAFTDILDYKATIVLSEILSPKKCAVVLEFPKTSCFGNVEKFLATWVRYLYERPYNLAVVDTIRLKRQKTFSTYSHLDLFNLVSQTYFDRSNWGEGHSISYGGGIYPRNVLQNTILNTSKELSLNSIGTEYRIDRRTRLAVDPINDMYLASDLASFRKRLPNYKTMLIKFENQLKGLTSNEKKS